MQSRIFFAPAEIVSSFYFYCFSIRNSFFVQCRILLLRSVSALYIMRRTMALSKPFYLNVLEEEFNNRKRVNTRYSLRAFARYLNLPSAVLSEIFRQKRGIPKKSAPQIADKLGLNTVEKDVFVNSVKSRKAAVVCSLEASQQKDYYRIIENRKYDRFFAEWEHGLVFTLVRARQGKFDLNWLEEKSRLSREQIDESIALLEELELISKLEDGNYQINESYLASTRDVPSKALRTFHHSMLHMGHEKLDRIPIDKRFFGASTFAINISHVEELKNLIRNFKKELVKIANCNKGEDVFQLNIQLFPLSKIEGELTGEEVTNEGQDSKVDFQIDPGLSPSAFAQQATEGTKKVTQPTTENVTNSSIGTSSIDTNSQESLS